MSTIVDCSTCGRKLRVPDELIGRQVKCPGCGKTFTAAHDTDQTEQPAPLPEDGISGSRTTGRQPPAQDEHHDEDPHPSRRTGRPNPEDEDFDEEPRPSKRGRSIARRNHNEDEVYDERPSRYRKREKPGKVQAIAIMTLVGGILAIVASVLYLLYIGFIAVASMGIGLVCCLWPGPYYGLVMGILATIKGSQLLGKDAHLQSAPKTIAILQIVNIINFDIPNCVLGVITLVFLGEEEVQQYYRG